MAKFRKKPVVVDAIQWTGKNIEDIRLFSGGEVDYYHWEQLNESGINKEMLEVNTLEGKMEARKGDWIIKGVNGEFYPCKPDIFEKTYEPIN